MSKEQCKITPKDWERLTHYLEAKFPELREPDQALTVPTEQDYQAALAKISALETENKQLKLKSSG